MDKKIRYGLIGIGAQGSAYAGFRRSIDELGMNVSSCTAAVAPMAPGMPGEFLSAPDDFKKIVADCKALDCDMLRIGMLPMNCVGSYQKAVGFARQAEELCLKLKEEGIDLYYHNHHVEFTKYDGEYLLDIIRANAPTWASSWTSTGSSGAVKTRWASSKSMPAPSGCSI